MRVRIPTWNGESKCVAVQIFKYDSSFSDVWVPDEVRLHVHRLPGRRRRQLHGDGTVALAIRVEGPVRPKKPHIVSAFSSSHFFGAYRVNHVKQTNGTHVNFKSFLFALPPQVIQGRLFRPQRCHRHEQRQGRRGERPFLQVREMDGIAWNR